jgi:hypothetical protein
MRLASTSIPWKNLWSRAQHQACATRKPVCQPWLKSSPSSEAFQAGPSDWYVATHTHTQPWHATNFGKPIVGFKSPPPGITFWEPFWASKLRAGGHNSEASFGFEFWYLATNFLRPVLASEFRCYSYNYKCSNEF